MVTASETPIFKEYCSYLAQYKNKYGDKTIVLMQVGSFYEIYGMLEEDKKMGEVDIYHICNTVMNIAVAHKTKNILMGGFQLPYSEKFIKVLVENGYVVVLVQQVSGPPNPVREVTEVISPGTYMEYSDTTTSHIMSVFAEKITNSFVAVGVSIIDVSTGNNYVYQIGENLDPNFWKDELSRLINYYSPREFIFHTKGLDLSEQDVINYWDIQGSTLQINHYKDHSMITIDYQNELLQKVFQFESLITPIEELDMVYTSELRNSYVYLLQYIYEHTQDIVRNIHPPQKINDIHHLSLTSNSVRQLNVVQNYSYYKGKNESLYTICDECGFIGGKRLLKQRLLYPSICKETLDLRYNRIEMCMKDHFYKQLQNNISKLTDIEKSVRKMGLNRLQPPQFMQTKLSYDFVHRVLNTLETNTSLQQLYSEYSEDVNVFSQFYSEINSLFNYKHFYSDDQSYFKPGVYEDLDSLEDELQVSRRNILCIAKRLSSIIDAANACKFDRNDKYGYHLYCTTKRSKLLSNRFQNIPNQSVNVRNDENEIIYTLNPDDFEYSKKDSSNVFIKCPQINELIKSITQNSSKIQELNQVYWEQTMDRLYTHYHKTLIRIHLFMSDLDVSCSGAKLAIEYKYTRPEVIEAPKACLDAKDMRHPIVERISVDTEYVTNDVCLGRDNKDGILLFGTNACGKSTLMKAIGLNVILAQAGLFVACSEFMFKPYTHIFTRILNNDNIFRAQSSFAVEMSELRSIFQMGNENSLILGDELCSGTETLSAISIVSKSLDILSKQKSSYIITSHLHQLTDIPLVQKIDTLDIYHLKIICNDNILTYDRKLCKGSGPPIYGLKVCEAMGLSDDFIQGSNEILKQLLDKSDKIVSTKVSQYSSKVFMDECKVCGENPEETHHIKEQHLANEDNMIDHHHKNKKHNLVPLCKKCHSKVTYGGLLIHGWKHTSRGKMLDYEYVEPESKQSKKYSQEQVNIILSYKPLLDNGTVNKTGCLNMIDIEHGFRPSMKIFNDILKGAYI